MSMSTIADVAKLAGVSTATVSRVLNGSTLVTDQTRNQVMEAVRSLDYSLPAPRAQAEVNRLIAVLVSNEQTELKYAIIKAATAAGLGVVFLPATYDTDENRYFSGTLNLLKKQLIGIILIGNPFWRTETPNELLSGFPVIQTVDSVGDLGNCSYLVSCDNVQIGYDATSWLIDQGCKRIAMFSDVENRLYAAHRLRGYQMALLDHNLPLDPALDYRVDLRKSFLSTTNQLTRQDLVEKINASAPPDAIFCVNDAMADMCLATLREMGLDRQVKIIGVDNAARNSPSRFPTIDPDMDTIGTEAVRMLVDIDAGNIGQSRHITVPHKLVIPDAEGSPN